MAVRTSVEIKSDERKQQVDVALSNSMGFGGHNAALLLRRWA